VAGDASVPGWAEGIRNLALGTPIRNHTDLANRLASVRLAYDIGFSPILHHLFSLTRNLALVGACQCNLAVELAARAARLRFS
jgi:hypothetical protein